jgi:hypothetical protein
MQRCSRLFIFPYVFPWLDARRFSCHHLETDSTATAAGRGKPDQEGIPCMPHLGPRCAHTKERSLPRPAATPSHHTQVGGLSVCVIAVLPLAHHQGSCQAPSLLLLHCFHSGFSRVCICLHGGQATLSPIAPPAGRMHMPPTVRPLLEPTDRHAGHPQA